MRYFETIEQWRMDKDSGISFNMDVYLRNHGMQPSQQVHRSKECKLAVFRERCFSSQNHRNASSNHVPPLNL
jgi:hypothetical protein